MTTNDCRKGGAGWLARAATGLCALLLAAQAWAAAPAPADPDWTTFGSRFIEADGRVVDAGQDGASHSEGQGYAMLLAVHYNDRERFTRLWDWTRAQLQVRADGLLAWHWRDGKVIDANNASDGDVLVAWALLRAGEQWGEPAWLDASARLAGAVRAKLVRSGSHGLVLAPGMDGFEQPEGATINLSYWIWPALRELPRADPSPQWAELAASGLAILQYSRFGRWGLPPDWLKLRKLVAPADNFPDRFGYDAVRIPLYLQWGGVDTPALLEPYRSFWAYFKGASFLPAWTSLKDDSVDSHDSSAGIHAIAQWLADPKAARAARLPALDAREGYYSASLLLLCKVALRETGRP